MSKKTSTTLAGRGKLPAVGTPVIRSESSVRAKSTSPSKVASPLPSAGTTFPPIGGAVMLQEEEFLATAAIAVAEEEHKRKQQQQEEEEHKRKQQQEEEEHKRKQQQQEEAERVRKEQGNGSITIVYNQYHEPFPIVDGSTSAAIIDEEYALSFVMPECLIHLSLYETKIIHDKLSAGEGDALVREDPPGVFVGLQKNTTYYCYVEEREEYRRRDQEETRRRLVGEAAAALQSAQHRKDDGRVLESCSCIEGNPCIDEYGCRDWHNRFATAQKNGWKGF